MAGSIFKKLRGLGAKFWTKQQFLLNRGGLRVDIGKVGGHFRKTSSRRGIFESGHLDLDRMARI